MVRAKAGKVGSRPNEFKYGMALYGAAWPEGDFYFVCGGGGHGLQNRIVWAHYRDGKCSDQVGEYKLGEGAANTPMKMVMCPFGSSLLVGMASGGIRRLQIGCMDLATRRPKLVEVSAAFHDHLRGMQHEVSTMAFNRTGKLLAVGFKEGGGVQVLSYPSMRPLLHWNLSDPEVKDLDFIHAPQEQCPNDLLASVAGDGSCTLWQLQYGQVQQAAALELPKKLGPKARFARCRFARDGSAHLYVLINEAVPGKVRRLDTISHLAVYGPPQHQQQQQLQQHAGAAGADGGGGGGPWQALRLVSALDQAASSLDISRGGSYLAAGFSEGVMRVFDAHSLGVAAEDVVSIAFVSSVVFNAAGGAAIAVCGDAICHVMDLAPRRGGGLGTLLLVLLVVGLVVGGALLLHYWQHPEALSYQALQRVAAMSRAGGPLAQACSSGGFPLHRQVCNWVQRAAALLPDEAYLGLHHDEL